MSFDALAPPAPGIVTAIIPGPATGGAEAVSPVLADAAAGGREVGIAAAEQTGADDLSLALNLQATAGLPRETARDAWLRPVAEVAPRLHRPWRELSHAERYLAGVARARLRPIDLLVLELPASRLPGPRVLSLVQDLAAEGLGVLWLERRLRLVACFAIEAWLLDRDRLIGPLAAPTLVDDLRARRLAFGGHLPAD